MIPTIIAEIGCNHRGEPGTAHRMVEVLCNYCREHFSLDGGPKTPLVIKSQKRTPAALSTAEYDTPHPNPHHAYGSTYGAHRDALELSIDVHQDLKTHAQVLGATYTCSVWDLTSALEVMRLRPPWIKIPSARNLDFELIAKLCGAYEGDLHISLGMTTRKEIEKIVSFVERMGRSKDTVLYACTSGYPVGFGDVCLLELERLRQAYGHRVKGFGFSGHHMGIAVDMAAVALGAEYIERHFTLNRTWKGTDHAASLEPDGFRKLLRDVVAVSQALNPKPADLLDVEIPQRRKLKRKQTDRVIPQKVKEKEVVV